MYTVPGLWIAITLLSSHTGLSQTVCPEAPVCDDSVQTYQLDGSCNNLNNPDWGTPNRPYARFVPAQYTDGIWEPALASSGNPLPNVRQLSLHLFGETEMQHPRNTLVSMQFGQFVAHDLSFTADGKCVFERVGVCLFVCASLNPISIYSDQLAAYSVVPTGRWSRRHLPPRDAYPSRWPTMIQCWPAKAFSA